jgi:hypothetical protein
MKRNERRRKMDQVSIFHESPPNIIYDIYVNGKTEWSSRNNSISLINGDQVEVALDDLRSNRYRLKKNRYIPVSLCYKDGYYIFIHNDLGLFGEARTLDEAEKEIANEIVILFSRLNSLEKTQLGPYPKRLLSILKEYIWDK